MRLLWRSPAISTPSSAAATISTPSPGSGARVGAAWAVLFTSLVLLVSGALVAGGCSRPRRPNVIVFLVDMLRPDHLGLYGYTKGTSPNLDRLATTGVVFEHAFAPAPWTYPSTVSLLTGRYPSEHGADEILLEDGTRAIAFPDATGLWLTTRFREAGYRTVAFHSHRYLHRSVSNINTAFDEYYYTPERFVEATDLSIGTAHWTDRMYVDTLYPQAEEWLRASATAAPFLMYLHLIDVHGPYSSDHGEGFGEHHDYWGHGRYVYNDQTRVPLVLLSHAHLTERPRRVEEIVNTTGVLPTLAKLARVPIRGDVGQRSFAGLLVESPSRPAPQLSYSETSRRGGRDALIFGERYKLITEWSTGGQALYDLVDDPAELRPLDPSTAATRGQDIRNTLRRLRDVRAGFRVSMEAPEASFRRLSPEAIEALEQLGYIR